MGDRVQAREIGATLRRHAPGSFAAFGVALALALPAAAVTTSTDYADLWYAAPAESQAGWGVNVAHQGDILFTTLFVYGADGSPRWYVAPSLAASGAATFTGALFTVGSGTWFGAAWTGISGVRQVGTITLAFNSPTAGSMSYSVDNVQTGRCAYDGTYSQAGSAGAITGTYHCDVNGVVNAVVGNFTVDELRATRSGFNGRLAVVSPQCDYAGYMGGVKDQF